MTLLALTVAVLPFAVDVVASAPLIIILGSFALPPCSASRSEGEAKSASLVDFFLTRPDLETSPAGDTDIALASLVGVCFGRVGAVVVGLADSRVKTKEYRSQKIFMGQDQLQD